MLPYRTWVERAFRALSRSALLYLGLTTFCISGWTRAEEGAPPPKDAQFFSNTIPSRINAGDRVIPTITVKNTGSTSWSYEQGFRLAIVSDPGDLVFGVNRLDLPPGYLVAPNASFTFNFVLGDAPRAGDYQLKFQMVQELVEFFGPILTVPVRVVGTIRTDPLATLSDTIDRIGGRFGEKMYPFHSKLFITGNAGGTLSVFNIDPAQGAIGDFLYPIDSPMTTGGAFGIPFDGVGQTFAIADSKAFTRGLVYIFDEATVQSRGFIDNPTPQTFDRFGWSVMTFGENLLITDPFDDAGASNAGSAYLFVGNPDSPNFGHLLLTINDPRLPDGQFGTAAQRIGTVAIIGIAADHSINPLSDPPSTPNNFFSTADAYDVDPASPTFGFLLYSPEDPIFPGAPFYLSVVGPNLILSPYSGENYLLDPANGQVIRTIHPFAPNPLQLIQGRAFFDGTDLLDAALIFHFADPMGDTNSQFGFSRFAIGNRVFFGAPNFGTGVVYMFDDTLPSAARGWRRYR